MKTKKIKLEHLKAGQVWADEYGAYLVVSIGDHVSFMTIKERNFFEYTLNGLYDMLVVDMINDEDLKLVATSLEKYYTKPVKKKKS